MTWGEISELSAEFLASLETSQQPEIDLKKENIISAFQAYAQKQEAIIDEKKFSIYEDILYLRPDMNVASEYMLLKYQLNELKAAIDTRKQEFISKRATLKNAKTPEEEAENKKLSAYLSQLSNIEKEIDDSNAHLIRIAIKNCRKQFFPGLFPKEDFSYKLFRVGTLDSSRRTLINFGELPVSQLRSIPDKKHDYDRYLMFFASVIRELCVCERIQETVAQNPLMSNRAHIINESLKYFKLGDFQMFAQVAVPQMEGFFRLYMNALHIHKETRSITDILQKIQDHEDFFEFIYFAYDFPVIRNSIAHGEVYAITQERAYELLMDLHWIVKKVDDKELDYKKWISFLKDFADLAPENQVAFVLDYFANGLDAERRIENLKRFFSHQYSSIIKAYDLFSAGVDFSRILGSKEILNSVWNEEMPVKFESGEEVTFKDGKKYAVIRFNDDPAKYGDFIEILNKNKLCPDEWYDDYKDFVGKVEAEYEKIHKLNSERSGVGHDN